MPVSSHFTILYGSQTGQAQAIAEEIHENSSQHGLQSKLFCLSQTEKKFALDKEPLVVFVVSTTGEGDPPDTMLKFMRRLKKKTLPSDHLKSCEYALLALGDTNYTNFCNNGKTLDRRLLALGAKPFYKTGYADDAVGLELVVDPWIEGLWTAVKKCVGLDNSEENECNGTSGNLNEVEINSQSNSNSNSNSVDEKPSTTHSLDEQSQTNSEENNKNKMCNSDDNDSKNNIVSTGVSKSTKDGNIGDKSSNSNTETLLTDVSTDSSNPEQPTLRRSSEPLSSSPLSTPLLPAQYLTVEYDASLSLLHDSTVCYHDNKFSKATVMSARTLTSKDAVKTTLEVELEITDCGLDYEPGDSFDIMCPNSDDEVTELIKILDFEDKADVPFITKVIENTTKKIAVKPRYIPEPCTIRNAFLNCLEIRSVPKKAMLRMLVEYTNDPHEKRRLQELCSKQGAKDYQTFIRQPSISLLELLKAFPSCLPPFERLLEHLPQLNPRPYSVATSPMCHPNKLRFVFNIVEFPPHEDLRSDRKGVCTGWLSKVTEITRTEGSIEDGMTKLQLNEQPRQTCVLVASRKHNQFRLPKDHKTPIVMIGPGTGVAPFISFLEHRNLLCKGQDPKEIYGKTWLFYGCRNRKHDFLYKNDLHGYHSSGVLSNLLVSFSREEGCTTPYVQDNLRLHSKEVAKMVFDDGGIVYVCGDAKNMAKDVYAVFCEIAEQHFGVNKMEAIKKMGKLRSNKQYHEDVWT